MTFFDFFFSSTKFSITKISKLVPMKHRNASFGVQTIGSPRMLKDVLMRMGVLVILKNSLIKL